MYNNPPNPNMSAPMNNNMTQKFMVPSQPQPFMMLNQGMNRVGMVPKPELPLHLQVLFAPRMPLVYVKPPEKRRCRRLDPIIYPGFDFLAKFEDEEPPEKEIYESKAEKKQKLLKQKSEDYKNKIKEALKQWNPQEDPKCTGDPMKTLFVSRISYETTEKKLKKEFEVYGPVKKIRLIKNITNNKPKGYAFIEFEHKKDFLTAYKQADGKKIDDRRVLVDCERGRTVKGWRPRRFGGGKGETRRARSLNKEKAENSKRRSKSKSKSRDKKKRSRSESRNRSRSRERSREREKRRGERDRDRDRERERGKDRDRDRRERKYDNERDKKEKNHEYKKNRNEKEQKKEKKEKKENLMKLEDEGEILPDQFDRKQKKKKGKEKDRSKERKRSKSGKEKRQKRSKEKRSWRQDENNQNNHQTVLNEKRELEEINQQNVGNY